MSDDAEARFMRALDAQAERDDCDHEFAYDWATPWRICLRCGHSDVYRVGRPWGSCANGHLLLPSNRLLTGAFSKLTGDPLTLCRDCVREKKYDQNRRRRNARAHVIAEEAVR